MKKIGSTFLTSQLQIKVSIKSLEIPINSPSCVFVVWYGNNFDGCSQLFHMAKSVVQIDKSFSIHASREKCEFATVQLKTKSIRGAIHHLGEVNARVPTAIFDGATNESVSEVETENGIFKIHFNFDILPEEDITHPSIDIRDPPNVSYYSSLLKRLKPAIFSPETPSNFWGPEGFHYQIESLVNCRATDSAIGELENLNHQIHLIAKDIDFYSNFIQQMVVILMDSPQYINLKNDTVMLIDRKIQNQDSPIYPILAIRICNSVQQYLKTKKDLTYLEMPLVDFCGLMAYLIADPSTDYQSLVHVISITCFVSSYLTKNYKYLVTIIDAFKVVEKDALNSILKNFNETIQQKCMLPSRIKMLITKNENLFYNAQVPNKIWEQLRRYIFNAIDYYVATSWIAGSLEINFDFQKYKQNFENAEFPYMTSIAKVCADPNKYLLSKNAVKELNIKGDWLYQTLARVNEEEKKITEQQLLKLVKDPDEPTYMTDVEYYVQNNRVFDETLMEIPSVLPVLSSKYQ